MNPNIEIINLLEQFKAECKVYEMEDEYHDHLGNEDYAIATLLTDDEFRAKYAVLYPNREEYILITPEMGEAIDESNRNNDKHKKREERHGSMFDINDGEFDEHHPEVHATDVADEFMDNYINRMIMVEISVLPKVCRRRFIRRFFWGLSSRKIGKLENVNYSTVDKSLKLAFEKVGDKLTELLLQ